MKCLICLSKEADKTGSHLLPSFMVKRIHNDGRKGRDNGIIFQIGKKETSSMIEQNVLPEHIKRIYSDYDPEELKKLENPNIKDNVFCSECEKKLSEIEGQYASHVNQKKSSINGSIAMTFWISIMFRLPLIQEFTYLTKKHYTKLRLSLYNRLYDRPNPNCEISYFLFKTEDIDASRSLYF